MTDFSRKSRPKSEKLTVQAPASIISAVEPRFLSKELGSAHLALDRDDKITKPCISPVGLNYRSIPVAERLGRISPLVYPLAGRVARGPSIWDRLHVADTESRARQRSATPPKFTHNVTSVAGSKRMPEPMHWSVNEVRSLLSELDAQFKQPILVAKKSPNVKPTKKSVRFAIDEVTKKHHAPPTTISNPLVEEQSILVGHEISPPRRITTI
jgi:hypothetical protein